MPSLRLVKILIILNIFIQTTNAIDSYVVEEKSQDAFYHSSSQKVLSSSWSLSNLWQSFQQTVSTKLLPYVFDFEKPSPAKVIIDSSWWKTPSLGEGEFAQQWHSIVTHIVKENIKHAQTLAFAIQDREIFYHSNEGQNLYQHKKELSKILGENVQRIAAYDKLFNEESKRIPLSDCVKFLANFKLEEKNLPMLRVVLKEFYSKVEQTCLKDDFYDGHLFQKGFHLADCLWKIGNIQRHPGNLSELKSTVLNSYKSIEKSELDYVDYDELKSLGIIPSSSRIFGGTKMVSGGMILLLTLSNNIMHASAAIPRSVALGTACDADYKKCESGFTLFEFYNSSLEINSILSNSYFQNATQQTLLESNRFNALNSTLNNIDYLMSTTGWYSEVMVYSVDSIPTGAAIRENYMLPAPFRGGSRTPINDTAYYQDAYSIYNIDGPKNITNSYTLPGTMNHYFLDQFPDTEVWFFSVMFNQSFGLGTAIMRPSQGVPSVLWQRPIIRESAINTVDSGALLELAINVNKPARATLEDNNTFDKMSSLHSGKVGQPYCQGNQTIEEYLYSQSLAITSQSDRVLTCMSEPVLDPLRCFQISGNYALAYTRFSAFFMENLLGKLIYHHRVADGPNYKACRYQQLNPQETQEICHTYLWSPKSSNIQTTSKVLSQNFSSLYGSLTLGQLRKVAEIFFQSDSVEGIVIETLQNTSGVFGPNYYAYCPTLISPTTPSSTTPDPSSITPNSFSSATPEDDSNQDAIIAGTVVPSVAILATTAGVVGWKLKKNASKKKGNDSDRDFELGNASTSGDRTIAINAFKAVNGKGLEAARLRVTGSMYGKEYGLYFKIDESEARDISTQTGLKIDFPESQEEMDLILGAGNFGQVRVVKEEGTNEYRATKIVIGKENVEASLTEGALQASLNGNENVLPLLEYLHYKPTHENKKVMKQLLVATFGSTTVKGEDMTSQDLLLQVTPLAAFGNGYDFLDKLEGVNNPDLKDQLLWHFTFSLLTGLKNMHDKGVSHLDIKPTNILIHTDGTIYVSDFGCALQEDFIKGGNGDFSYFSPERMAHIRYYLETTYGNKFKAQEKTSTFSAKAADAFAAGLTLLECVINLYPLGFDEVTTNEMADQRDSEFFRKKIQEGYKEVHEESRILPIIQGLLLIDPKKRWTTTLALSEALKRKPQISHERLLEDFTVFLKGPSSPRKEVVNANDGSAHAYLRHRDKTSTSKRYWTDLPSYKVSQQAYDNEKAPF